MHYHSRPDPRGLSRPSARPGDRGPAPGNHAPFGSFRQDNPLKAAYPKREVFGAQGRARTGTSLRKLDFKSKASTIPPPGQRDPRITGNAAKKRERFVALPPAKRTNLPEVPACSNPGPGSSRAASEGFPARPIRRSASRRRRAPPARSVWYNARTTRACRPPGRPGVRHDFANRQLPAG